MPKKRVIQKPDGKIEKAEDKIWNEWFEGLDVKEHEQKLKQLGLDEEDIEEWEEVEGFKPEKKPEPEKTVKSEKKTNPEKKPKPEKKKK